MPFWMVVGSTESRVRACAFISCASERSLIKLREGVSRYGACDMNEVIAYFCWPFCVMAADLACRSRYRLSSEAFADSSSEMVERKVCNSSVYCFPERTIVNVAEIPGREAHQSEVLAFDAFNRCKCLVYRILGWSAAGWRDAPETKRRGLGRSFDGCRLAGIGR